jgi:CO/xanthine dehydrogenase Mo-binding subunit
MMLAAQRKIAPAGGGDMTAFYKFTGKRLHHMPFTPARVQQVLKA